MLYWVQIQGRCRCKWWWWIFSMCVFLIWKLWVSRSCEHFPSEMLLNNVEQASLHFSLLTALNVTGQTHSRLHHFPSCHAPGELTAAVMSRCFASAGSSIIRLTLGVLLNPEETHNMQFLHVFSPQTASLKQQFYRWTLGDVLLVLKASWFFISVLYMIFVILDLGN